MSASNVHRSEIKNLFTRNDAEFTLFGPELDRYTYTGENPLDFIGVDIQDTLFSELWFHKFKIKQFVKKQGFDAVIYGAGARMLPPKFKVPSVVLVNDVLSTVLSESRSSWQKSQVCRGLSKASCVIVPSIYAKNDMLSCGIKPARLEVVYSGVDRSIFYPEENLVSDSGTVDIKPFAIKKPYIIYPSRMHSAQKKHVELIKAFSLLKKKTSCPHRLVLAGNEGAYSEEVHKAVLASEYASDIFITGYFPHQNFPELYRGAEACVFPSVNEGAALPVLESLATGVPLACSKCGALKELAGDNALFFDSSDIQAIAFCMETLLFDSEKRAELIKGGLKWTENFSWEKNAGRTLEIIKEVTEKQ